MALKETTKHLKDLLNQITQDIEKADGGNKAASQRVRTGTVKLEKIAKVYRKESIKFEKTTKGTKKSAGKKVAKGAVKKAPHAKPTPAKGAKHAGQGHANAKHTKPKALKTKSHSAKPRALSFKKPSAKLLTRKHH